MINADKGRELWYEAVEGRDVEVGGEGGGKMGEGGGISADIGGSQVGEAVALLSTVFPGRRGRGRVSRCSRKETWKELRMWPVEGFQRW